MDDLVWVTDVDGNTTFVNTAFTRVMGLQAGGITAINWSACVHPEDREMVRDSWMSAAASGQRGAWVCRLRGEPPHEWRSYRCRALPLRKPDGTVNGWAGFAAEAGPGHDPGERMRLITDNSTVLLAHCDTEARFTFVNKPYADRFGLAPEQIVGSTVAEVLGEVAYGAIALHVEAALRGETQEFQVQVPYSTLGQRWVQCRYQPDLSASGEVRGFVAAIQDVTQQREAEEASRHACELAEQALRAKDDFLAALSHELRTPLTPVLMTAASLESDMSLSPALREQLHMMRRNIELEARLIDDLLDLTRLTHGKLPLVAGVCDVHGLLGHASEIVRSDLQSKRVDIRFLLHAGAHHVQGDAARLQQVFWNLLKNAIKFTPTDGEITVRTSNPVPGTLRVEVEDNGVGIAHHLLGTIFEAFNQGDQAGHRFGGLGLGLAISRGIVQLHGGVVRAASGGPGLGATFTVELTTVDPPPAMQRPVPTTAPGARPLRLLLVEDHEPTLVVLQRLLERQGHTVTPAATVSKALEAFHAGEFDILLSDLGLPDQSGIDLIRKIRETSNLPAIAISGYGMDSDVAAAKEAGFQAHLVKPVNFDQVRRLVEQVAG